MARCLIVGCGCRGRELARELRRQGNVVRGTTRSPGSVAAIEAAGAEAWVADPDRLATLVGAFDHVSVAYLLLGSAVGSPEALAALHGERLEALLFKLVDTTVRVVVYESTGTVDAAVLDAGAATVRRMCEQSRMLYAILDADSADPGEWVRAAVDATRAAL